MGRQPRVIIEGLPHHITQRGVRKGDVFFKPEDRKTYLELLEEYSARFDVRVVGYCLMTNHVHLLLIPPSHEALSKTLKLTHMRYSGFINTRQGCSGHLWQQRYYSSPVDKEYFAITLRYIERNPISAGMVLKAWLYPWSSAASHCGLIEDPLLSDCPELIELRERVVDWHQWLEESDSSEQIRQLQDRLYRDLPCGSTDFVGRLEQLTGRKLSPTRRKTG